MAAHRDNGIPDHLVEITREIEAETSRRVAAAGDDRAQARARIFGQYVAAAAELLAEEAGVVGASAVLTTYADQMLVAEAQRMDALEQQQLALAEENR